MSWRAYTPMLSLGGLLVLPGLVFVPAPRAPAGAACSVVGNEIVDLQPTGAVAIASGTIELKPLMSPFGVSVTTDGRYRFEASTTVKNLPDPSSMGPYKTWILWLATPSLDKIRNLGPVTNGQVVTSQVDFTKMMYIVSAEATPGVTFKGPLVLVGRSASARVQNLAGCDIYDEQSRMGG